MRRPPTTGRALLVAALGVALACGRGGGSAGGRGKEGPGGAGPGERPPAPVTAAPAVARDVPDELSAVGSVAPLETVSVRPLVTGELVAVHFREGDEVARGQLLFEIDPRPYAAALAQARGALERAREQAANAHADVRRYRDLVKKGYVTAQQYDTAVATARALDGDVAATEGAVRKARLDLANCRIESPLAGRTGALLVQRGNVVQANQPAPLVVIAQLKPISVAFTVPAANVAALRGGVGAMKVTAEAQGAGAREGRLTFVNNTVDPAAGTILGKATFPNEDEALWPGEYVDVHVVLGVRRGAVVAPAAAVVPGQAGSFVWVVKGDGTVEERPVKVAHADARDAVIAAGLSPGEVVVTDGQLALVPGARVAVRQPEPAAGGKGREAQAGAEAGAAPRVQGRRP